MENVINLEEQKRRRKLIFFIRFISGSLSNMLNRSSVLHPSIVSPTTVVVPLCTTMCGCVIMVTDAIQ